MTPLTYPTENRRNILLIGDSYGILKRIAFALQRQGHSVIWGSSGEVGLRAVESDAPDLIICETRLSDGSGIDLCRTMKASFFFSTPIVLVGKLCDEKQDAPRALNAGADDYIGTFTDWQLVMAKLEWMIQRAALDDKFVRRPGFTPVASVIGCLN